MAYYHQSPPLLRPLPPNQMPPRRKPLPPHKPIPPHPHNDVSPTLRRIRIHRYPVLQSNSQSNDSALPSTNLKPVPNIRIPRPPTKTPVLSVEYHTRPLTPPCRSLPPANHHYTSYMGNMADHIRYSHSPPRTGSADEGRALHKKKSRSMGDGALRMRPPISTPSSTRKQSKHTKAQTITFQSQPAVANNTNKKMPTKSMPLLPKATPSSRVHHPLTHKHKRKAVILTEAQFDEAELSSVDDEKGDHIHWLRGELVGVGAFGKVYRAWDKYSQRVYAVKQVPFDPRTIMHSSGKHPASAAVVGMDYASRATMIDREATVMKQLRHENIVQFYDYQRSVNYKTLCIVMEYVDGPPIDIIYQDHGCFAEAAIRKYGRQIMSALQFAHERKVVHRDLKGRNILVSTSADQIKLADFGSAKLMDSTLGTTRFTPSINYNYTPLWTAPEVLLGDCNEKMDIWSVGCVLIEMASASPPWSECNFANPFAALVHIGHSDHMPAIPSKLSTACQDFIRMCLQRNPSKRSSATELLRHKFLVS